MRDGGAPGFAFFLISMRNRTYRTIFFYRLNSGNFSGRFLGRVLSGFYRPLSSLKIFTRDIGPGLFIEHGECTIISAKCIGADAWINQGVTIGWKDSSGPP